jgi:hypothetical protein
MRAPEHQPLSRETTRPLPRGIVNKHEQGSVILVLLVSALLLLVVLALGTLSSININFVRSQVEYNQALLTAQAATAQLIYEMEQFEIASTDVMDLSAPDFRSMDLKSRFARSPVFPPGTRRTGADAFISFDNRQSYYSTDNSLNESPCRGWKDRGENSTSVPPFSIDLMITVKAGGSTRHFEAIINRRWPYAAFCARGPIVITATGTRESQKTNPMPSVLKGDILSLFDPRAVQSAGGGSQNPDEGTGADDLGSSMPDYAHLFYGSLGSSALPDASICIGGQDAHDRENKITGNALTSAKKPRTPHSASRAIADSDPIQVREDNYLVGKKRYDVGNSLLSWQRNPFTMVKAPEPGECTELKPERISTIEVVGTGERALTMVNGTMMWKGSELRSRKFQKIVETYLSMALQNPLQLPADLRQILEPYLRAQGPSMYAGGPLKTVIEGYMRDHYFGCSCFMKNNLVLEGTSESSRYYLRGDLFNHYVTYDKVPVVDPLTKMVTGWTWRLKEDKYSKAGLTLRNCTLFVDGDMELTEFSGPAPPGSTPPSQEEAASSSSSGSSFSSINGKNATLIVSGNLRITGGRLDSMDKGMVIFARNIEFSTGGSYKGLIMAQGAIVINPYPKPQDETPTEKDQLHILGGIACMGEVANEEIVSAASEPLPSLQFSLEGLVLKSVDIQFDPRYAKSLHRFGRPRVSFMHELE